jgi:hypothetical protein
MACGDCVACSYTTFNVSLSPASTSVSLADVQHQLSSQLNAGVSPHLLAPLSIIDMVVTNTGGVDSDFVGLLFAVPPGAGSNGTPLRSLVGFRRVFVAAGATVTIPFDVTSAALSVVDVHGVRVAVPGQWHIEGDRASGSSTMLLIQ